MATKLNDKYLSDFIGEHEYDGVAAEVKAAHKVLHDGSGLGNDFLGWLNLPTDYDKEEFARIKKCAEKIKKDTDVFIVIGIGGSYLGARAAIEFLSSQNYNLTCKDTPQIFFTGNSISSSALAEIMELCEGKDVKKVGLHYHETYNAFVHKEIDLVVQRDDCEEYQIYKNKSVSLDYLGLDIPTTTDELEQVLIAFRDHADDLKKQFDIEGDVIPMSFIINNGDQDPAILINGFGEGYGDTGDHFAVKDDGTVIYTTVQEGYKEGIEWLHKLVTEDLVDPEAFTQEWSTYVAKGKNHRYGLCFTWDIANIDNNTDLFMMREITVREEARNIKRQNKSETLVFDRGRCVVTSSCRTTALAAAWIDQMYAPLQSPQNNWGSYGEKDSFNIFELSTNKDGGEMLKHLDLGDQSPVEVREAQSVNGPLAVLNEYYDVYVTQPADAKWRLDNMHETYLKDMKSKYVYPNVFMSIDDTNKVSQYDTDIKKYAEQKKADWILNGGIEEEWDSYLEKMEKYGLSDYLSIKQKYFDQYQESLSAEK